MLFFTIINNRSMVLLLLVILGLNLKLSFKCESLNYNYTLNCCSKLNYWFSYQSYYVNNTSFINNFHNRAINFCFFLLLVFTCGSFLIISEKGK